MNIHISIPNGHVHAADRLARQLGISRNELYRKAIELFLEERSLEYDTVAAVSDRQEDDDR